MKRKASTTRPSSNRDDIARLEDIPNVGPAVAADLRQLGSRRLPSCQGVTRMRCMMTCAASPATDTTPACSTRSSPPSGSWKAGR